MIISIKKNKKNIMSNVYSGGMSVYLHVPGSAFQLFSLAYKLKLG